MELFLITATTACMYDMRRLLGTGWDEEAG
jgi:hypothetical protein